MLWNHFPFWMFGKIVSPTGGLGELADSMFVEGVSDPKTLMIIVDKDNLRKKHFVGALITGNGTVLSQTYWDPFDATPQEKDLKPAVGKEILVTFKATRSGGGQFASTVFKVWAGLTKDSKTGARDVFGTTFTVSNETPFPPFILKSGEYFSVENLSGAVSTVITEIVGVERDET